MEKKKTLLVKLTEIHSSILYFILRCSKILIFFLYNWIITIIGREQVKHHPIKEGN